MARKEEIYEALSHHFGFESFKGNQEAVITSLLSGHDVFVLMPTGGGKSLCYQLPALMLEGTAIIISPLIALMKNQVDAIRTYCNDDSVAHFLNSSLSKKEADKVRMDVVQGKTKLLYMAPESLTKEDNIAFLQTVNVSFYAVDEAHCISEWGHDFRVEYRNIRPMINRIGQRPVIALTATATPKVQHDIQKNLGMLEADIYKSSFNRPNLYYEVRPKTKEVDRDIIRYIKSHPGKSGIIYCLSRKKVEELAELLRVNDIRALPYHAGMDAAQRSANQDAFIMEEADVIVATIAFGMGIDKPDVRFVIHYDMPKSLEGYYQETGRAGRDGGEGACISFFTIKDLQKMEKLMQSKPPLDQEIGRQLLAETAAYAESSLCRRKSLLHYFGEEYPEENCGGCDNCVHPRPKVEAGEEMAAVLGAFDELGDRYRSEFISNVIIGRATDELKAAKQTEAESFGVLKHKDDKFVHTLIRHAIIAGFLKRDMDNFNILRVTPEGEEFMDHPRSFKVVEDRDYNDSGEEVQGSGQTSSTDPELYSILSDMRRRRAKMEKLPPYVIFQDPSLEAMTTYYPMTLEELQNIPGVGAGKAKRYGQEFVDVIRKYVEEKEIVRPEDFRVKKVANRNNVRLYLLQGVDRKSDLDDLARGKDLDLLELIQELEGIVLSGNKLNIDYYIEELLDDDQIEDILDYFMESEEDDIDGAIEDLGEDYTEEEIRLVRIKFLSENAN